MKIRSNKYPLVYPALLCCLLLLTSCAPIVSIEQGDHTQYLDIDQTQVVGQSFVARYQGLQSIAVYLKPGDQAAGAIRLSLKNHLQESQPLASAILNLDETQSGRFYRFPIEIQRDSNLRSYYFELHLDKEGYVSVGQNGGASYLNGAMYLDGFPQDSQLAFRLSYDTTIVLTGLLLEGLKWLGWLIGAIWLAVIPGWGLLSLFWPGWKNRDWVEKLGLSFGVSLSIYPILMVWLNLLGVNIGALYAWFPATIIIMWVLFTRRRQLIRQSKPPWRSIPRIRYFDLLLLLTIVLILLPRFWVIRGLEAPMWGDGYQHTMMAQLLVDNNGLFESWEPYAALETFTYHFGFHAFVAAFHWITRLPLAQATLISGQVLNAMAVIALYPLTMRITRSRWAGLVTILSAGLLLSMPFFYVNWSRYTQLAGLVILAALVALSFQYLEVKPKRFPSLVILWITLAGLALAHFRVLIFGIVFYFSYWLYNFFTRSLSHSLRNLANFAWITAGGFLLFLPRLFTILEGKLTTTLSDQLALPASQPSNVNQLQNAIGDPLVYLPVLVWVLLPLLIGWGLWRRNRVLAIISLWWLLVFLAANPQWFGLPGAGVITNFAVLISAYFLAALLIGSAAAWILEASPKGSHLQTSLQLLGVALLLIAGYWGARERIDDVDPYRHALLVRPDNHAAEWIQQNTTEETTFLVNSFFAYAGTSIVGSDGGWWLPLNAGRQTTLPPLTYASEQGPRPDYQTWINELTALIESKGVDDPEVLAELKSRGVTHVYIGQRQGSVNSNQALLDAEVLLSSPNYTPIYQQDRVYIFRIND